MKNVRFQKIGTKLGNMFIVLCLLTINMNPVQIAQAATIINHSNGVGRYSSSTVTDCATQTQIPAVECNALLALYNSTNGAGWTNNTGWLQTNTPCSWFGVTCAAGYVAELDLGGNNLVGTIPAALSNLTNITKLVLAGNHLSGLIPIQLGNLTNLTNLELSSNQLSGSIPSQLGNLTSLTRLNFFSNQLSGSIPPQLGNLINLTSLGLESNQLTGSIPTQLGNLTNLIGLFLGGNQLSGSIPIELSSLTQLRSLHLSSNNLTGFIPTQLSNLTTLTYLSLDNNQLSGSIPIELNNLTQLQWLELSNNQLTGSIPSQLSNLTNLTKLTLKSNHLGGEFPTSITNLANLTNFTFDCWITSSNPSVIAFIDNLVPGWQNSICPVVLSITRSTPNPTSSSSVSFSVVLSETVTGVNTSAPFNDFAVATTGVTGSTITGVNGSGATYTVTVNTGSGNGMIRLNVVDDNSIIDAASSPLGGGNFGDGDFTLGETYTILKNSSFGDVSTDHPYFSDIEILYANGYTGGCSTSPLLFCPEMTMDRAQAAVFMLRGYFGSGYQPQPPIIIFEDDWEDAPWTEGWAEAMYNAGLSAGCSTSPLLFCPHDQLTNVQTAVFGLRMKYGVNYQPPAASGMVFADVTDVNFWGTPWAEQAHADGLIPACGTSGAKPLFCPNNLVSRGFGASIIVKAKNLTMP